MTMVILQAWQNARRQGFEMRNYNIRVARAALQGTKWEELLHFWDTNVVKWDGYVVFGEQPNVAKMLALDKKIPEMFLMGKEI